MSVKTVAELASGYFNTLNPIAERISSDIETIKDAYEDLWQSLSKKEKEQIINDTVIYPEAVLKYALRVAAGDVCDNGDAAPGGKYLMDEHTGQTWRDEHAAPFSWKTPSQINLHLFGTQDSKTNSPLKTVPFSNGNAKKTFCFDRDKTIGVKFENGVKYNEQNHDDKDGWGSALAAEKNLARKLFENPDSPNLVLGGTCSRISGLCSRLKFLPGKTCSYEVKTVVSYVPNTGETNFLNKIKANTVLKIQNTIRLVGGKSFISSEKKQASETAGDVENLVQPKSNITVVKQGGKPSPKVAKPKSPPPPPPKLKPPTPHKKNPEETLPMIVVKTSVANTREGDATEAETATLLKDEASEVQHDSRRVGEDQRSLGASSESIPKSGFDFLDNW